MTNPLFAIPIVVLGIHYLKNSFQEEENNELPFIVIHLHLQDPMSTSQTIGFRTPFPTEHPKGLSHDPHEGARGI